MERIELSEETIPLEEKTPPDHLIYGPRIEGLSKNRRIYYIDVGDYGKKDAEKYIDDLTVKYKRKEVPDDAGYFYCPYIPTELKPVTLEHVPAETAGMNDILSKMVADELDELAQTTLVAEAKSVWSEKMEHALWDSISTTTKLEALGIDKSFLEFDFGNECVSFEDECQELAEDLDEFEMMVEFNKIADPNWSDDRMAFALNLFKQGWKAKTRVEEQDDFIYGTSYCQPNPFITYEDLSKAIITTEL